MSDGSLTWSPINIGKARILGLESEGEIDINKFLAIGLNYTYLDPTDKNTGEKIPNQPKYQFNTLIRVYSSFGLGLSLDGRYVKNYVSHSNPSGYFVMDGKITQRIDFSSSLKGEAFFLIKNIFDREYQTVKDYPMPPREIYGGLSIAF
jgi:outer membrane cobalamin receptor